MEKTYEECAKGGGILPSPLHVIIPAQNHLDVLYQILMNKEKEMEKKGDKKWL